MSLSGVNVPENTIDVYEKKRFDKTEGGLVLKIDEDKIIIESDNEGDFSGLVNKLPEAEPRYVLYDVPVKNRANLEDLRTIFLFWMPMSSPVRLRMHYASTKSIINNNFRGIAMQIQEEEKDRLSLEYLQDRINKTQGINNPTY